MDVYVHIGPGKTGSSAIQGMLNNNRERLAALGYLYPKSPGPGRHPKLSLYATNDDSIRMRPAWSRFGGETPEDFRSQFATDLRTELRESDLDRVILSDEVLFGLRPVEIERFRDLIATISDNVRLIAYLRRQDDHMISRYQQMVKTGEIDSLPEFAAVSRTDFYDFAARLDLWRTLMPDSILTVRRFERSSFVGGSLLQDFLDCVAIKDPLDTFVLPTGRANRSLDADAVKFLRLWNIKRVEHDGATPRLIDNRKHVRTLGELSTQSVLSLSDDALDAFMERWEASNARVAKEWFDDSESLLFREPRRTHNITTNQALSVGAMEYILDCLHIRPRGRRQLREIADRENALVLEGERFSEEGNSSIPRND